MGLFGLSKQDKFVRKEAKSLALFLKNNAVKFGGEAYAKCQAEGVLGRDIDKALLWYFWTMVFGFRVAHDTHALKKIINGESSGMLFRAFIEIDQNDFNTIEHAPYEESFVAVNHALDVVQGANGRPVNEQAAIFLLHAIKSIQHARSEETGFVIVQNLVQAVTSFPSLAQVIQQNA